MMTDDDRHRGDDVGVKLSFSVINDTFEFFLKSKRFVRISNIYIIAGSQLLYGRRVAHVLCSGR